MSDFFQKLPRAKKFIEKATITFACEAWQKAAILAEKERSGLDIFPILWDAFLARHHSRTAEKIDIPVFEKK